MKVLIDEQLPVKLKYRFADTGHEVQTVKDMGWLGKTNGELLGLMVFNGFDVLLTNDKNIYYQQRITGFDLTVININTKTNVYEDVLEVLDEIKQHLNGVARQLKQAGEKTGKYRMLSAARTKKKEKEEACKLETKGN